MHIQVHNMLNIKYVVHKTHEITFSKLEFAYLTCIGRHLISLYLQDGDTETELSMRIQVSKKVIICVFMHTMFNYLHVLYFNMNCACIGRAYYCMYYNGNFVIEVGPNSRQVPVF